ncbi:MAG: hypothetical protein AAF696_29245 [Bacteroidota bacterium]
MESKQLEHEAGLIRKILGSAIRNPSDSGHPVLVDDWEHNWNPQSQSSQAPNTRTYAYINNPTGSIRWFFPADTPYPAYLGLYNSAHLKARIYKLGTHAAFSLGVQRKLFTGYFSIKSTKVPFENLLESLDAETYAVFTGTVGENRKSVAAIYRNKEISHFIKMAHTKQAENILKNEASYLRKLGDYPFFRLIHPRVHPASQDPCLILSNIKPKPAREVARLEDMHVEALAEIYKFTHQKASISETDFYRKIHENLGRIYSREVVDPKLDTPALHRVIDGLIKLSKSISEKNHIPLALAHGDFTPWNMYLSDNYVHVYDWELAKENKPLLFDFFHFMYQSGVMLLRQNFSQLEREINRSLRLPHTKKIIKTYKLDIQLCHKLYLLSIISYYLRIYMDESQVHMQVHWLLDIWKQSLEKFS